MKQLLKTLWQLPQYCRVIMEILFLRILLKRSPVKILARFWCQFGTQWAMVRVLEFKDPEFEENRLWLRIFFPATRYVVYKPLNDHANQGVIYPPLVVVNNENELPMAA